MHDLLYQHRANCWQSRWTDDEMTLTQRHCQTSSNNAMLAQRITALWSTVEYVLKYD